MALIRQTKSATLFRCLVVPSLLLCCIFRRPVFQWIALAASIVWLSTELVFAYRQHTCRRKRTKSIQHLSELKSDPKGDQPATETDEHELFLIRQINYRITEQLKENYPMVSWLWQQQPNVAQLCKGGLWRIRLSNTEPFNYGEVEITRMGKISITLLQAVALKESKTVVVESEDIAEEELLDKVDVKAWYQEHGEQLLSQIIDDLNTQGHRQILIKEDGAVCVTSSDAEQIVDSLLNFPPRKAWMELKQLLLEDEITASEKPEGLLMAWN